MPFLPPRAMLGRMHDELDYLVEETDAGGQRILRELARASHLFVGRAAFEAAVRCYPRSHITFRHRARLIDTHAPGANEGGRS